MATIFVRDLYNLYDQSICSTTYDRTMEVENDAIELVRVFEHDFSNLMETALHLLSSRIWDEREFYFFSNVFPLFANYDNRERDDDEY